MIYIYIYLYIYVYRTELVYKTFAKFSMAILLMKTAIIEYNAHLLMTLRRHQFYVI